MKGTAGGIRSPRLVKSLFGKSDVAWYVEACVDYKKQMKKVMQDGIERLVKVQELVSSYNLNLVTR